ncbi:hypothetical protein SAMN04490194_1979 [Pseudomonas migulae]|uniref:Uncharacterized protein n=1 Tax=Pseudomonas migulae TaxID=78543 RepID=A0A1H5IB88_9PSED|nr:hypothetical protein SAMN04490194_1979 [Pseudomonas migulae]
MRRCCRPSCDLVQSSAKRANLDGFALFCVRVFGVGFALGNWGAIRPPSPASRLLHVMVRRRHCWGGLLAMRPEMRWRPRNWPRGFVSLLATRRSLRRCCRPSCDLVQSSAKRANLDGFALFCVRVFGVGFALGNWGAIRPPSPASRLLQFLHRIITCRSRLAGDEASAATSSIPGNQCRSSAFTRSWNASRFESFSPIRILCASSTLIRTTSSD